MTLLAQTLPLSMPDPNSAQSIGWLIVALVAIGGAIVLFRKVFGQDPPLHKEYVTKSDHEKALQEIDRELKRHAARRAEIYDEQKLQAENISGLKAEMKAQTDSLADLKEEQSRIRDRIDDVPQRTINILRTSGALK